MKKLTRLINTTVMLLLLSAGSTMADYKDMADEVETVAEIWVGGYFQDADTSVNTAFADTYLPALPEAQGRVGYNKAAEYYYLKDSGSGGILFKDAHAPNRLHLEFDYFNEKDWHGDFRYSFKDYILVRVLPRRLFHNLENLTVYDYDPASATSAEVEINDAGIDDYGLTVDIDEYRLRFKTPNFPFHIYSNGEIVRKKGKRQQRFLGGAAYFFGGTQGGRVRVTELSDVDTEKQEYSLGTNAHLGPLEVDISQTKRTFESDNADPTYMYEVAAGPPGFYSANHNSIPKLEATTNTLKVHSAHSGRIFGSATYSEIEKTNEDTGAEAENKMGYGEVYWLPTAFVSFSAKYRQQKNETDLPATTIAPHYDGTTNFVYTVEPGIESQTDTASLLVKYSQVPKTTLKFQYTNKIREYEDESVITWSRPKKLVYNIYEVGLNNWAIPKVRITSKFRQTNIEHDFFIDPAGILSDSATNEPENTYFGNLGLTWSVTPKVAAFFNANITKEVSDDMRLVDIAEYHSAEALRQQYIGSLSFMINEKLSISPTYTYMLDEQHRDLIWENNIPEHFADHDYRNKQEAHNVALHVMARPSDRLDVNASIDYTATEGNYMVTSPFDIQGTAASATLATFNTAEIARFSYTKTQEIGVRLDTDLDLGRGWGVGLGLRYIDWKDDSFDNPSDSTFLGGLLKLSKKIL